MVRRMLAREVAEWAVGTCLWFTVPGTKSMRPRDSFFWLLMLAAAQPLPLTADPAPTPVDLPILMTQAPPVDRNSADASGSGVVQDRLASGSRIALLRAPGAQVGWDVEVLTQGFATAGRSDLSFDGRRFLFVAQRTPADPLGVWEMNVDGSDVREVLRFPADVHRAIYLPTLFTLDRGEPASRIGFLADADDGTRALFSCAMDGSDVRRLSFSPFGVSDPYVLSDGRLLFRMPTNVSPARERPWRCGAEPLFTINTDGTDLFPFTSAVTSTSVDCMPRETDVGDIVWVESTCDDPELGGSLMAVSRRRNLGARRWVAGSLRERFAHPFPMRNGTLLVSHRPAHGGSRGLYRVRPGTSESATLIFDDPQWDEVEAIEVQARPEPAGRSSSLNNRLPIGVLYCLNAYLSDSGNVSRLEPGTIRRVRVVQGEVPASPRNPGRVRQGLRNDDPVGERVVGEVPVESDGSFSVEVPALRPLRVETLDGNGNVLLGMKTWMWVMPGENRGCIGCHEDRALTPPNRHVLALRQPPQRLVLNGADVARPRAADPPPSPQVPP